MRKNALFLLFSLTASLTSIWACNGIPREASTCRKHADCFGSRLCSNGKCQNVECSFGVTSDCYTHSSKFKGIGICKVGKKTCDKEGKWGSCKNDIAPAKRNCKSTKDNDCNGTIDQKDKGCKSDPPCKEKAQRACYTGPKAMRKKGICKDGKQTCKNKKFGECLGQILADLEICGSGKDEDCDGKKDFDDTNCQLKSCTETIDGTFCPPKEHCLYPSGQKQGKCAKPCKSASDCKGSLKCVRLGPAQPKHCLPTVPKGETCDPEKFRLCPPEQYCQKNKSTAKETCTDPNKAVEQNATCDNYGFICKKNLVCTFISERGICLLDCRSGSGEDCGQLGPQCAALQSPLPQISVCLQPCSSNTDCSKEGNLKCPSKRPPFLSSKFCIPPGSRKIWSICSKGGTNCEYGLHCYIDPTQKGKREIGYCQPDKCDKSVCKLPNGKSGANCINKPNGKTDCLVNCRKTPEICKEIPGTTCRRISSQGSICLP